jgi:DNA-binding transcriptional LysR family regulator
MDWDNIRFFLALAREKSVRRAGEQTGVSHSTVSRRVGALEEALGGPLFVPLQAGNELTKLGEEVLAHSERIEAEMANLQRSALGADDGLVGPVHLTCWDAMAGKVFVELLATFCATHPGIELKVSTDERALNLTLREADVALRVFGLGRAPADHLIGHELTPLKIAAYVSRKHAQRWDPDRGAAASRWPGYDALDLQRIGMSASCHPDLPLWGEFASTEVMTAAVRCGLGMGMLPCYVGDADPALQRAVRPRIDFTTSVWLVSHPDLRKTARLRALRNALRESSNTLRDRFAPDDL